MNKDLEVINAELIPIDAIDSLSICHSVESQVNLLTRKTPPKYIKKRAGRGGLILDYVDIHYVTAVLNAVFFLNWDFEILSHEIVFKENQVVVKGRLRVHFADGRMVIKEAFGSSEIKQLKAGGMVDLADDLKGAASDALKKAASLLGIAYDVYSGQTKASQGTMTDVTTDNDDDFLSAPKDKDQFKNLTLQLVNGSTVKVSKFEALTYFGKLKAALGEEAYYAILKLSGYAHANEIPPEKIAPMYAVFVQAWKSRRAVPKTEAKQGELPLGESDGKTA